MLAEENYFKCSFKKRRKISSVCFGATSREQSCLGRSLLANAAKHAVRNILFFFYLLTLWTTEVLTLRSQLGQELLAALLSATASLAQIRSPILRSASMVPRNSLLGSGISESRSLSSSSAPSAVEL